ncbi:MAG: hypothetical protein ACYC5Y_01750 [Symbiobacteriia bacterium]
MFVETTLQDESNLTVLNDIGKQISSDNVKLPDNEFFVPFLTGPWGTYVLNQADGSGLLEGVRSEDRVVLPPPGGELRFADVSPNREEILYIDREQPSIALADTTPAVGEPVVVSLSPWGVVGDQADYRALFAADGSVLVLNYRSHQVLDLDQKGTLRWRTETNIDPTISPSRRSVAVRDTSGLRVVNSDGSLIWQGATKDALPIAFSPDDRWLLYKGQQQASATVIDLRNRTPYPFTLHRGESLGPVLNDGLIVVFIQSSDRAAFTVEVRDLQGQRRASFEDKSRIEAYPTPNGDIILQYGDGHLEFYSNRS